MIDRGLRRTFIITKAMFLSSPVNFPVNDPKELADFFEERLHRMGPMGNRILDYVEEYSRGCRSWDEFLAKIQAAIDEESDKVRATGMDKVELVNEALRSEYMS